MSVLDREPVQAAGAAGSVAQAAIIVGTLFGLQLTTEQSAAVLAVAVPLVGYIRDRFTRSRVYAPSTMREFRRALKSYDAVQTALSALPDPVRSDRESVAAALRAIADEGRED